MTQEAIEVAAPGERFADLNTMVLCYEEFGDPADETVVLVMGLGVQMLGWDPEFCQGLVERGFHVVRFDNRDVGRSSKFSGRVNLPAGLVGLTGSAIYELSDMAADTAALIEHLGLSGAHLVGVSMGGMISQTLAARHPERVLSLCSIMSGAGRRSPKTIAGPKVLSRLLRRPADNREDAIEGLLETFQLISSPAYPMDRERVRGMIEQSYERSYCPAGFARQMMAVLASGNRIKELGAVRSPTVVIHGDRDRLVPLPGARDTAEAIPGARLEIIPGMGHDLPPALYPRYLDLIEENARRGVTA